MKKGFTLAELMGVIIILGVIGIIATTTVSTNIRKSHYNTCLAQAKNIEESAKTWTIDHAADLPTSGNKTLTLAELQAGGYMEDGLKSPMTNKVYSSGTKVTIATTNGKSFTYTIVYGDAKEECTK